MSNYNNIKPYNEFNHTAATHGGVEKYIDELKKASYSSGRIDERASLLWKIPLAAGIGIGLWEAGKACVNHVKKHHQSKKEAAEVKVRKAEEAAREAMSALNSEESQKQV